MKFQESFFIDATCDELDYKKGALMDIKEAKDLHFSEKYDWLTLYESINNSKEQTNNKIFFVNDEPVIVFTKTHSSGKLFEIYNRIWCMARPRFLYLESPGGLYLLDLAKSPVKNDDDLKDQALAVVNNLLEIKLRLNDYRREQIESGKIFENAIFSDIQCRADISLIRDLTIVRNKLYEAGLSGVNLKYAHALIGKSIFIRYLEDRGILSEKYFYEIANSNSAWKAILDTQQNTSYADAKMQKLLYPKVLSDKKFSYALFKRITKDFNGDIFPTDEMEEKIVQQEHLEIIKNFLDGNVYKEQKLFFWAYQFNIIPIELISNIYEEFYHYNNRELAKTTDTKGTYYTPITLVEFVLRKTLTSEVLAKRPRILDPACGSGIFLVQSFRRIVRFELFQKRRQNLPYNELLGILKEKIAGIELNEEAVKITAFSLYLAFLHYQTPPDILLQIEQGNKLPHLIFTEDKNEGEIYFDILVKSNAFSTEAIDSDIIKKRFVRKCANVVVGNPPWGSPPKEDTDGRIALEEAVAWCKKNKKLISDKERSQAFIWKAMDFLKEGGTAGLLVSSGIFFKHSDASNAFKQQWLDSVTLQEVANFIHVRNIFFNGAISPFLSVIFKNEISTHDYFIDYWTFRRNKSIENTRALILDKTDFKFLSKSETVTNDIWKIFYFGNHRDLALIEKLRIHKTLEHFEFIPDKGTLRRQGFIEGNKKNEAGWLKEYEELPADCFNDRYNQIDFSKALVEVPDKVKELGAKHIYEGLRILVGKISQKTEPKGQLIVRLENKKFAFRNTINCIKLKPEYKEYYKVFLGILWSSVARYYFFMTSSKWGVWHDQVLVDEILQLPIILPKNEKLFKKIITVVDQLRNREFIRQASNKLQANLFQQENPVAKFAKTLSKLEKELDSCIFELYRLSEAEIELIEDRCQLDIDFFYNDSKSRSVTKIDNLKSYNGDILSLSAKKILQKDLNQYLYTFINLWNIELANEQKFSFRVLYPYNSPLIAVIFNLQNNTSNPMGSPLNSDEQEWAYLLKRLDKELNSEYSTKIYIEGIARIVTDEEIVIIKRNEQGLWTSTSAREDVDATILQAMIKQESHA